MPTAAPVNILFTAAGRRVSLVRLFRRALDSLGLEGRLVTADLTTTAPAHYVADEREIIPRCTSSDYIPALLDICRRRDIRLLVPLIDTELMVLARHRDAFAEAGVKVMVSHAETIAIGNDKRQTAVFFEHIGMPTPRVLTAAEVERLTASDLPVFAKPWDGSSSVGARKITTLDEARRLSSEDGKLMVMLLASGDEVTVDVYADFAGTPRCAVPRRRLEVRAGEVSKALTLRDPEIIARSLEIVRQLPGALGCITLQCFREPSGRLTFIEINPRFGGGYPLAAHAGADYPRWMLEELTGRTPDFEAGSHWKNNLCMLRFDEELILDGGLL